MSCAIGIDVGTSNVKVVLVDADGVVLARASRSLTTSQMAAVAEQDGSALWNSVVAAIGEVTARQPAFAKRVVAIGTASQYSSIIPVDGNCEPTAPMRLYLDTRGTERALALLETEPEAFATWIEHHGIPPIGGGLSLAHILHLQNDDAAAHERTAYYLEPMDFVTSRLTGRVSASQCSMFASQLCDNRSLDALAYDSELVDMSGIDASRLPPLLPSDELIGTIQPTLAAELGLPADTLVLAGMNDSQAGALATGAFQDGRAGVVIGTTAVLLDTIDRMAVDLDHEVLSMPSPIAGQYLVCAENGIAGRSVEHVLVELLRGDVTPGSQPAPDPFDLLDEALATSPPGANGVLFLPWLAGSMAPEGHPGMRGGFLNLALDSRRVDLARAAVEGTAHNLAWLLKPVEDFNGHHADSITFGGGAARSAGWARVLADVLGRTVETLSDPEVANARAVGLVALARSNGSAIRDLGSLVQTNAVFEADPMAHQLYQRRQQTFEAAFGVLRPLLDELNG